MNKGLVIAMTAALLTGSTAVDAQDVNIGKSNIVLSSDV